MSLATLQKQTFHFDEKNLSYTINRFNFFKLNKKFIEMKKLKIVTTKQFYQFDKVSISLKNEFLL